MDIFIVAMRRRWRLVYGDLFAGPGLCVDEKSGMESKGSPLRAIEKQGFSHLFLNDASSDAVSALRRRIGQHDGRVTLSQLDCNEAVDSLVATLFPSGAVGMLGLVFIDPAAFQMQFDAVRRLTADRRVDLIITFMTGYIQRFRDQPGYADVIDRFVGTDRWRKARGTRDVLDVYEAQLQSIGYEHVDDDIRIVNSKHRTIYHLVFASSSTRSVRGLPEVRVG